MAMQATRGRRFNRLDARLQGVVTRFHVLVYRASCGRIGHYLGKIPVLLLTTVGRKSGKRYVKPLTYIPDGDDMALVASNGGTRQHPAWWLNLQARPETVVQVGARRLRVRARQATPEERARLWPQANAIYPGYDGYQRNTDREIPIVILAPIA